MHKVTGWGGDGVGGVCMCVGWGLVWRCDQSLKPWVRKFGREHLPLGVMGKFVETLLKTCSQLDDLGGCGHHL